MFAHLADVSIRSLLLALSAATFLWMVRSRRSAALQHAVWTAVVGGMLALFAFGQMLPRLPLRVLTPSDARKTGTSSLVPAPLTGVWPSTPPSGTGDGVPAFRLSTTPGAANWKDIVLCIYVAITLAFLARFITGMFLVRGLLAASHPAASGFLESAAITVPLTVGYVHPQILLPLEWREWDRDKLNAVLAHEGAHVRRRDGLAAALAGVNRCIFWFHPLAWMLERKLSLLAELACDESCVATLGDREQYARLLLEMACVVDGARGRLRQHALTMAAPSHLRRRIDSLLQEGRTFSRGLTWTGWAAVTLCGIPAVLGAGAVELAAPPPLLPLSMPRWNVPVAPLVLLAQTAEAPASVPSPTVRSTPKFEVASIRPSADTECENSGGGRSTGGSSSASSPERLTLNCYPVIDLIRMAYSTFANGQRRFGKGIPIEKIPAWINSARYTIKAETEGAQNPEMMKGPMLQALLEDRYRLTIHRETREVPVYELTVAKGGFKNLTAAQDGKCVTADADHPSPQLPPGQPLPKRCGAFYGSSTGEGIDVYGTTIANLCTQFSAIFDRNVIDKTGINGVFDLHLATSPVPKPSDDTTESDKSSLFLSVLDDAIQKLGLRLESAKGLDEFLVIDSVERPSEN
jgi:uncharacterized protein (TIGR03435 family)